LTEEDRQTFEQQVKANETELTQISKDVDNNAFYSSPYPTGDGKAERMTRRIRKWHWRYFYSPKNDHFDDFIELRDRLPRAYAEYQNSGTFKIHPKSFDEFLMDFFRTVALAHEVSQIVHAEGKIESEYEFLLIVYFGELYLDQHFTTLINAIGIRKNAEWGLSFLPT